MQVLGRAALVAGSAAAKKLAKAVAKKKMFGTTKKAGSKASVRKEEAVSRRLADKVKQGTAEVYPEKAKTAKELSLAKKIKAKASAKAPSNSIKKDYAKK